MNSAIARPSLRRGRPRPEIRRSLVGRSGGLFPCPASRTEPARPRVVGSGPWRVIGRGDLAGSTGLLLHEELHPHRRRELSFVALLDPLPPDPGELGRAADQVMADGHRVDLGVTADAAVVVLPVTDPQPAEDDDRIALVQ